MKRLNNIKKSRLKMAMYTIIFLGLLSISCVVVMAIRHDGIDLTSIATTSVAGILTITTMYIGGDSYRKSDQDVE